MVVANTPAKPTTSLDHLVIKTPCTMDWGLMDGDNRKRFCSRCEKHVYDVSQMTRDEALELFAGDGTICAKIYRRPDGTIVTSECPPQEKKLAKRRLQFSIGALIALLTASAGVFATSPWIVRTVQPIVGKWFPSKNPKPTVTMGSMCVMGDVICVEPTEDTP
ncbi:hypothetical protein [Stieleria varia]|uniref:Uncharacterized protein n=1 Tax=Stieleria varia TaxID=2528005 RepID=A0A5C6AGU0_9BACT|nr:hypothetical protein [Stieleria varia]TWT98518.1 hypothetical protein Pla52n_50340 [Stieleria varia]